MHIGIITLDYNSVLALGKCLTISYDHIYPRVSRLDSVKEIPMPMWRYLPQIPPHRDGRMGNGRMGNGHMGNGHMGTVGICAHMQPGAFIDFAGAHPAAGAATIQSVCPDGISR